MRERKAVAGVGEHLEAGVREGALERGHDVDRDERARVRVEQQDRAGDARELGGEVGRGQHCRPAENRGGLRARLLRFVPARHFRGEGAVEEALLHQVRRPRGHAFLADEAFPRFEVLDGAAEVRPVRHRERQHALRVPGREREGDGAAERLADEVKPVRPGRVGDRLEVLHRRVERPLESRGERARPVAAKVEADQPVPADEGRGPAVPGRRARRDSVVEEHRRRGTLPRRRVVDHLVRDRAPATLDRSPHLRHAASASSAGSTTRTSPAALSVMQNTVKNSISGSIP